MMAKGHGGRGGGKGRGWISGEFQQVSLDYVLLAWEVLCMCVYVWR